MYLKQKRELQRQQLIEGLQSDFGLNARVEGTKNPHAQLVRVCTNYLCNPKMGSSNSMGEAFFFNIALPRIEKFSRAMEERDALVAELLVWATRVFVEDSRFELLTIEIHEPDRIYESSDRLTA